MRYTIVKQQPEYGSLERVGNGSLFVEYNMEIIYGAVTVDIYQQMGAL